MIITIDGPAGVGKNTVCELLAKKLNMVYMNSGAIYRTAGYIAIQSGLDFDDISLAQHIATHRIDIKNVQGTSRVFLDSHDITDQLQTPEISHAASLVSRQEAVRVLVTQIIQSFFNKDIIIDGRDAGTHIAPHADLKIYLDAKSETRAMRRFLQLQQKGFHTTYEEVLKQTKERDHLDSNKGKYSTQVPKDGFTIATDNMSAYDVVESILSRLPHDKQTA